MRDTNLAMVAGNLTADPELHYPENGGPPRVNFTLAVNRDRKKEDGEPIHEVHFVGVVAWRRLAEICAQFLKKGRKIIVVGHLSQSRWKDKEGKSRSKVEIQADTVQFMGRSPEGEEASAESATTAVPAAK